jgi:hypothetical protein
MAPLPNRPARAAVGPEAQGGQPATPAGPPCWTFAWARTRGAATPSCDLENGGEKAPLTPRLENAASCKAEKSFGFPPHAQGGGVCCGAMTFRTLKDARTATKCEFTQGLASRISFVRCHNGRWCRVLGLPDPKTTRHVRGNTYHQKA